MNNKVRWINRFAAISIAALVVAACSKDSDEANLAAQQQAAKAKKAAQKQEQPADPLAGMIAAVTASKGELPVEVRFEFGSRPEPGKPVDIKVAFAPKADLLALQASIKPGNGLQMASEAQPKFDALKSGDIKDYVFSATPAATGIYIANLELTVTRETGANTYVYSIPVAVPEPTPATASSSAAAKSKG